MGWNTITPAAAEILTVTTNTMLLAATEAPAATLPTSTLAGVVFWIVASVAGLVWLGKLLVERFAKVQGPQCRLPPCRPSARKADRQPPAGLNDAQGRIAPDSNAGKAVTVDEVQRVLRSAAVRPGSLWNDPR